jgi:hypothetical protein
MVRIALAGLLLAAGAAGCGLNKKLAAAGAAALVEDTAKAAARQSDPALLREGMPAFLMLLDGMVAGAPDDERPRLAAARAYAAFAAVLDDERDQALKALVLARAKLHALAALERRGFPDPAGAPFEAFERAAAQATAADLPVLFWAGSCWAGWAASRLDAVEAVAELPRIEVLMRRALALDEGYYYGGPHLFMGVWYASRPPVAGGSLARAREHFEKALAFARDDFLMTRVYFAEIYGRKAFDRELFESELQRVLAAPADAVPDLTLLNAAAQRRAAKLLALADDYF